MTATQERERFENRRPGEEFQEGRGRREDPHVQGVLVANATIAANLREKLVRSEAFQYLGWEKPTEAEQAQGWAWRVVYVRQKLDPVTER